jgi:acyl carrier protein
MAIGRDEIFAKVQEVLVDALGVDEDEVKEDSTLMGDLGAESIDFLDVVFRLEKSFNIKIAREELFPAESLMGNPDFVQNGKLTPKGIAELKSKMPHAALGDFEKDPDINKLGDLFTVGSIISYLERKVNN